MTPSPKMRAYLLHAEVVSAAGKRSTAIADRVFPVLPFRSWDDTDERRVPFTHARLDHQSARRGLSKRAFARVWERMVKNAAAEMPADVREHFDSYNDNFRKVMRLPFVTA